MRDLTGFLYDTFMGRCLLSILVRPSVSKICGRFMDSRASAILIRPFILANSIDMSQFYSEGYRCFNDCFVRRIKPGKRPFDMTPSAFCSPCDGLLTVYEISDETVVPVKQSQYSIPRLLYSRRTARRYEGGLCLAFRLCVDNYHRYSYFDSGIKGSNHFISGKLHTVRPIALEKIPVFTENCREYTVMKTDNFGTAVQMEVGAMLVGKIKNHHGRHVMKRGEEKGYFCYGGSTIILLFQKGRLCLDDNIIKASRLGIETPVIMGEKLGMAP
ncbi:MAG: phosphatidylserine decarboxylase [Lachnospiraceae bacterium]|nr:phosphatidylserine decarboxylase [Lachnospiraceae bacterium]